MLFTQDSHRGALVFFLALSIAILTTSCGENNPPKRENPERLAPQSMPDAEPKSVSAPRNMQPGTVVPPGDAQYTISCHAMSGPNHVEIANALKANLIKQTPLKDWYVIHEETQSVIYHGFYKSIDRSNPREQQRAQGDLKMIQGLTNAAGDRIFAHSYIVEVTTPDPQAPPEWNLANANGYWSLQIAAYKDSPKRKQFAVDAVREARKEGIPAYYLHGETTSMVFVGAWPRSAVKEQDESTANAADPTQPLLVLNQPLPSGGPTEFRDVEGNRVRALAPRLEPLDPSLIEALQRYPNNVVNGELIVNKVKDPLSGQIQEVADPSFLVVIPQKQTSLLSGPVPAAGTTPFEDTITAPSMQPPPATPQQPAQQGGRLRSLND
jgi:hypothetical protein